MNKHYNVLFLSMSCNQPLYQAEVAVIKDTWAKPIVDGKYPGVGYFSYTACNEAQPVEGIIYENNEICCNCPDNIENSYLKTITALRILKSQGITWDHIVRTNTSTWVNVNLTLTIINSNKCLPYFGTWVVNVGVKNHKTTSIISGCYMILNNEATDILISTDVNNSSFLEFVDDSYVWTWADDFIISKVLIKKLPVPIRTIPTFKYKTYISNDLDICKYELENLLLDYKEALKKPYLRLKMVEGDRINEIGHFYELYKYMIKQNAEHE